MKKVLSILTCALLLACTVLPFCSSADGMILWQDDFSSANESDWIWDGDKFEIENGKLDGWAEAVVHQSEFREDVGGTKKFRECAFKITAHGLEDGGHNSDNHALGLWFADYISADGTELGTTGTIVYKWFYNFEKKEMQLFADFSEDAEQFMPADYTSGEPVATYPIPDGQAPELDQSDSAAFTFGLRIKGGVISGYLNDKKIMDFNAYRGTASFSTRPSPIVLWNTKCHAQFDDLIVATADYDLFNEGVIPAPGPNDNPNPNPGPNDNPNPNPGPNAGNLANNNHETKIETIIETETDAEGNTVTKIVSQVVTVPAADTNTGAHGVGGAQTGDMAVVVVAVMVVALGSAVAVKKFSREG